MYPTTKSSSLHKFTISDRQILQHRIKRSPKYDGVCARTNSGFNTQRKKEMESEIRKYYKVRNDEIFKRISLSDLIELMIADAEDRALEREEREEEEREEIEEEGKREIPLKYRNELQQVVQGMDDMKLDKVAGIGSYLLVDVRPAAAYHERRLAGAVSYPAATLSRAVAGEHRQLVAARNHPAAIIVLYDQAEEVAAAVAAGLQFRGYGNVFVLSGGLSLARDKIGSPLVTAATPAATNAPITLQEAAILKTSLEAATLPPLTMAAAAEWWMAANGPNQPPTATTSHHSQTEAATSRHSQPPPATTSSHHTNRSVAAKPKPWR
ncbi:hypothetical protein Pmani_029039 [Petrolisthes manimaculis]|uniref:Rhodanese domain-containing protein n=1 Tax=Petrolisthes manimaculis TaxID=1843537 RepID=A0AAE1NYC1_9EUCA|nr:hypothetical protein Pmani_029039 [Petrolisthes manimaculis]